MTGKHPMKMEVYSWNIAGNIIMINIQQAMELITAG
jgi:hypothetical protein